MILRILFAVVLFCQVGVAEARWKEASTRHFLIYSEANEADLRRAAEQLERYDSMLRVATGVTDPDRGPAARVSIYFVRDVNELRQIYGNRESSVWGFYLPYSNGPMIITPRIGDRSTRRDSVYETPGQEDDSISAQGVLLHEYTHHFMFNNFNFGAPLWLSEGYPEFFSTARFEADGSITIGAPPRYRGYELRNSAVINAEQILLRPYENHKIEEIYGIGWLMSHYLTLNSSRLGRDPQLRQYMRALAAGRDPAEAASVFGDLGQLTADLREYRRTPNFPVSRIPADRISTGPITIRDMTDGENAIMPVRIRSKRGVNRESAQAVVHDARQAAAPYPNDPFVQVSLAEAEYDSRNYDAAEAAADRAIAASPNLVDAHLYKARAIWARAEAANDKSAETWRRIRGIIAGANRLDPNDPEPLFLFYQSYEPSGTPLNDNAIDALLQAHALAPQDDNLRFTATRELLRRNLPQRAAMAWGPLVSGEQGNRNRDKMAEIMGLIRAGNTQAALTKMEEMAAEARERNGGDDS